ncbi:MAG: hypothetical protein QG673_546 [Pseudomonadota bacterium]|nr:hypothetical protein [Pseudomonadota bacterium]
MKKIDNNIKYVMDASAIIAVANQEPHIPELPQMFLSSIITTINLAEALIVIIKKLNLNIDNIWDELRNFVPNHYPINDELTYAIVKMAPYTNQFGLSLGDKCCLGLAQKLKLPVYTGDRIWKKLETQLNIEVNLIR